MLSSESCARFAFAARQKEYDQDACRSRVPMKRENIIVHSLLRGFRMVASSTIVIVIHLKFTFDMGI